MFVIFGLFLFFFLFVYFFLKHKHKQGGGGGVRFTRDEDVATREGDDDADITYLS